MLIEQSMHGRVGWKRDILVLIFAQVAIGAFYLSTVPRIYTDEVWDSSIGYSLAYNGSLKNPFLEGYGGMHIHFVQPRVLLPLVCAVMFKVAGYSILSGRICSLFFAVLSVISLYAIMRYWFDRKQAICGAVALLMHPWFFEVSRRIRPEIYYTALGLVVLWWMALFFSSGSRWPAFFAGVFAGLSALSHPTGIILILSIGFATVIWLRTKSLGRLFLWAGVGFILVIVPYLVYVFWATQDPQVDFFRQIESTKLHRLSIHGEILRWKAFLKLPKGVPLALIMSFSWILAWYRSSRTDKTVATIIVLFSLILPFTTVSYTPRYLSAITPFFCALMIRLIWRVIISGSHALTQNWYKLRLIASVSVVLMYVSVCVVAISLMFHRFRGADFNRVVNRIASVVGSESRVYGQPILWVGHNQYQYGPFVFFDGPTPADEAINAVFKHRFDYVIRSAWLFRSSYGIAKPPKAMPPFRKDCILDQLSFRFGTKIDEFRDPHFGPFEIYKLKAYLKVDLQGYSGDRY
jgi:hypothetical protein